MAGYSGTPLGKKLGYCSEDGVLAVDMPGSVRAEIEDHAPVNWTNGGATSAHLFATKRSALERHLTDLRRTLPDTGMVWVSWPKKASGVQTDITEDTIRAVALPLGFVDIKVCAIDETWSGLKLVVRKELRRAS